jgi:XTP/dITP diphosphohydrolase
MRVSEKIVLASTNPDKLREFQALIRIYPPFEIVSPEGFLRNADKIGYVEVHSTYLENATAKARLVNQGCHYPTLADDSGLEVAALGGRPGIHSARYSKLRGTPANAAQYEANRNLLLQELRGKSDRSAKFICALALVIEGLLITATGEMEGQITEEPRGDHGFGYDPIFLPKGSQKTLGQMTEEEKNLISHRTIALKNLFETLETHGIVLAKP